MQFSRVERTDLVISMTLAEIFLLLLFVVWYGYSDILKDDPIAHLKEQLARLEKENATLNKRVKEAEREIVELEERLNIWRTLTGFDEPPSREKLRSAICRSRPMCEQENNVLIMASLIQGQISIEMLNESAKLSAWQESKGRLRLEKGVTIVDGGRIDEFLADIGKYYVFAKKEGADCRFDYRLRYETKEDYHDGRHRFENTFYAGGGLQRIIGEQ